MDTVYNSQPAPAISARPTTMQDAPVQRRLADLSIRVANLVWLYRHEGEEDVVVGVLGYAVESQDEWNLALANSAVVRVEPDETAPEIILISGTCPRCGHGFAHAEPIVVFRALDGDDTLWPGVASKLRNAFRRASALDRSCDVSVSCTCRVAHPGSPEGVNGCGASLSLHVEWGSDR